MIDYQAWILRAIDAAITEESNSVEGLSLRDLAHLTAHRNACATVLGQPQDTGVLDAMFDRLEEEVRDQVEDIRPV